ARYIAESGAAKSGAADYKSVAALAIRFEDAQEILGAWHDYLLLLDEARSILPEQSPTTLQLQEKSLQLRHQANEIATHLLATFPTQPSARQSHPRPHNNHEKCTLHHRSTS
ncbi:MAG: hypothetical protein ACRD3K_00795, partial [Edaphobacter sp.]